MAEILGRGQVDEPNKEPIWVGQAELSPRQVDCVVITWSDSKQHPTLVKSIWVAETLGLALADRREEPRHIFWRGA